MNKFRLLAPIDNVRKDRLRLNKDGAIREAGDDPSTLISTEGCSGEQGGVQVLKASQGLGASGLLFGTVRTQEGSVCHGQLQLLFVRATGITRREWSERVCSPG